jgi:hypothetical protein
VAVNTNDRCRSRPCSAWRVSLARQRIGHALERAHLCVDAEGCLYGRGNEHQGRGEYVAAGERPRRAAFDQISEYERRAGSADGSAECIERSDRERPRLQGKGWTSSRSRGASSSAPFDVRDGRIRLSLAPQVVAVQLDEIEGIEKHAGVVPPVADAIKARHAVAAACDRLTVDDAGTRAQPRQRLDDQREAAGEIVAGPAVESQPGAVLASDDAKSVAVAFPSRCSSPS